eukprot:SAG31_NODE_3851_length_3817_cov_89.532544_1_plen_387_part_10
MRANTSLILWCWHILFCVLSGNDSHITPIFDCIVIIDSIGNFVPGLTFIDLLGSTCATLTSAEDISNLPINLDGGNVTSSDFQISSTTDVRFSGTTKGMQINFFPRIISSGLPGGAGATLDHHVDAEAFIPEDYYKDGGNATSSDLQIRSGTSDNCTISCFVDPFDFSTTTKTCTGFAPRYPFSSGGTIATLTPRATFKDFNLNTYLDSGNRTSDNCTIGWFTDPFDFSTTTKTCTGFAPRQASTNLPSGAGSTLTSHATANEAFSLDAGNRTSDNCTIGWFTDPFDFSTTTKTCTGFAPRQASTNLPSGAGSTLTSHATANEAFSLDAGNRTSDNCSVSWFTDPFDFPITTKTCTCFVTSNLHNVSKRHSGAPSSRHLTLSSRTHI